MRETVKYAFINAIGTALYVAIIASLIYLLGNSKIDANRNVLVHRK